MTALLTNYQFLEEWDLPIVECIMAGRINLDDLTIDWLFYDYHEIEKFDPDSAAKLNMLKVSGYYPEIPMTCLYIDDLSMRSINGSVMYELVKTIGTGS